jgi:hypothetical protein
MDMHAMRVPRLAAVTAIVVGLAAGSYGIASAAGGSGSGSSSSSGSGSGGPAIQLAAGGNRAAPNAANPWGGQRSDETPLTGDAKASVQKAALSKVPGGKIVRIETDADGHAAYEAHMTKADGTPVTVYVDKQFNVVSVESR